MKLNAAIIGPAHGLKGEVILDIRSDNPDVMTVGAVFDTSDTTVPRVTIASLRVHRGRVLARFEEITTREAVEALRGVALLVEEYAEEDAWYLHELRGMRVVDTEGHDRGVVVDVIAGAAQDLVVIRTGERQAMVPFVRELVPEVDPESQTLTVNAIPGLLDDDVIEVRK